VWRSLDAVGDQIGYRLGDTVIGHENEIDIPELRQHFRAEMIGRADR
jgi:hypothetical protein